MSKHSMNWGHRQGKKMAAELGFAPVEKARGGKVGMPRINARAGIKAPPKVAKVKSQAPAPVAPVGIAAAAMPKLKMAKGGPVKSEKAEERKELAADKAQDKAMIARHNRLMHPGQKSKLAKGGAIHINPANKGKLHATLKVPSGKKIPMAKLQAAKNSPNPVTRKRANFAINARGFKHKARGGAC